MVRAASRRLSGTVGAWAGGRVRACDARRHLRARDRVAAAARPPRAQGPSRVRLGVPDRSATGYRSDDLATALRRRQGPGPDGTRPPTCGRCLPYAPGVVGQMKVLQFAKNVRESSLIIWVAE